jgi:hypothetical protein
MTSTTIPSFRTESKDSYARKSSEEKTRQIQSIEDQIAALQPLIDQNGLDERNAVVAGANRVTESIERSWKSAEDVADFCVTAARRYASGGVAERGMVARQLGVSYVLRSGRIEVELNGLIGLVREHRKEAASSSASLEPSENGFGNGEKDCFDGIYLGWGG